MRWLVLLRKVCVALLLIVVSGVVGWAFASRAMLPLEVWHTAALDHEFAARDAASEPTLEAYLAREEALFAELRADVYDRVAHDDTTLLSRYRAGGVEDPARRSPDWNRTFEFVPEPIRGGVLLLHGLTDSPYSLRRVGDLFRARGFYVLGLRLPGHGTIPAALTHVDRDDWIAASRIGARHVRERIGPTAPFVIAGYSNGGGLAVEYALDAQTVPNLPRPDSLLLFSPEIGIARIAVISNIGAALTRLPYFEQFRWLSIEPEYDPYKYNSFPKNAAEQAWKVTDAVQNGLTRARAQGRMRSFPPMLTFLSWTDSTVHTSATIQSLYDPLENADSELVIFDVNRFDALSGFMPAAEDAPLDRLGARPDLNYRLTVIGNAGRDTRAVVARSRAPHSAETTETPLGIAWPQDVYSLSHVAIPFAPDDPVYGDGRATPDGYEGLRLGALQPRGETSVLTVSASQVLRLRYNPFFAYVERRVDEAIDMAMERAGTSERR